MHIGVSAHGWTTGTSRVGMVKSTIVKPPLDVWERERERQREGDRGREREGDDEMKYKKVSIS